jgi:hypothetical protein
VTRRGQTTIQEVIEGGHIALVEHPEKYDPVIENILNTIRPEKKE